MLCGYHLSRGRPISEIVSSAQPMEAGSTRHYKSHTKLTILLQAIVFNFVASHSSCQNTSVVLSNVMEDIEAFPIIYYKWKIFSTALLTLYFDL